MSLKETLKKIGGSLSSFFNKLSDSTPEGVVQDEMRKEGWTFGVENIPIPQSLPVDWAKTPEGRPAFGLSATDEDRQRYRDTVTRTRRQLGLDR